MHFIKTDLDSLRKDVSNVFGKEIRYTSDTEELSEEIYKTTSRKISSTTIKRFWGLANYKGSFGTYTLDSFKLYIELKESNHKKQDLISILSYVSNSCISATLSGVHKSGKLLKRSFFETYMDSFFQSGKPLGGLIAPGGYGKSCIFVDYVTSSENNDRENYYVTSLMAKEFELLSEIHNALARGELQDKQILLFIDDITGTTLSTEDVNRMIHLLTSPVILNPNQQNLRILFSTRSASWKFLLAPLFTPDIIAHSVFGISESTLVDNFSNVPSLSLSEITQFSHIFFESQHTDPTLKSEILDQMELSEDGLTDVLAVPLYLKLFLARSLNGQVHDEFSLIVEFFKLNIFDLPESEWYQLILDTFLQHCDFGKSGRRIPKNILMPLLNQNKEAYLDLLRSGVLIESSGRTKYSFNQVFVQFSNSNYLEVYVLLRYLSRHADPGKELLEEIMQDFNDSGMKFYLIKWLLYVLFDLKLEKVITEIFNYKLNTEKNDILEQNLMVFNHVMSMQMRKDPEFADLLLQEMAKNKNCHRYYFEKCVDLDYLTKYYKKGLTYYLKEARELKSQIRGNHLLFLEGFLTNNTAQCKETVSYIRSQKEHWKKLKSSPYAWAIKSDLLYSTYFEKKANYPVSDLLSISEEILRSKEPVMSDFLTFQWMIMEALIWVNRNEEALLLAAYTEQHYRALHNYKNTDPYFNFMLYKAFALLRTGKAHEAEWIFRGLDPSMTYIVYTNKKQYSSLQYQLLKLEMIKHSSEGNFEEQKAQCLKIAHNLGYTFFIEQITNM
ncbi:hypothetical protein [Fluviicola sp.]|uniref:hypothetical protein n=1 Tax=Fluviicola sp. TaxID=1917219 RepID=UPI00260BA886|nr:hypothetical protein [Fluviicola sp.]